MLVRVFSDLHVEFDGEQRSLFSIPELPDDKDTTLILAGDIDVVTYLKIEFWEKISSQFERAFWVFGNHEFYHGDIHGSFVSAQKMLDEAGLHNIIILNDGSFLEQEEGIRIIGGTLWSDLNKLNPILEARAKAEINDYRKIRNCTTRSTYLKNKLTSRFIFEEVQLALDMGHIPVVVTHHPPSGTSINEQFKVHPLSRAFYTPLEERILDCPPAFWFHGHIHYPSDYLIGDTRIIANPRGYPNQGTPPVDLERVIEIKK